MLMAAIRDAQLEPCLLSARPATSRLSRLTCSNVSLDFAALGPAVHFTGAMAHSCYTLVFVIACPEKGRAFNFATEHADGYMGFFPPDGEVDAITPEGYVNATLTVSVAEFHDALAIHYPEVPERVLKSGAAMTIGPAEQVGLRSFLSQLEESMCHSPEIFTDPLLRNQVERELLSAFIAALRSGCANLGRPPTNRLGSRFRRLRQAREFLAEHSHRPIYLDDLCVALGLNSRAVENLFKDLLGLSPMTYLRHHRLHGARRSLLQAVAVSGSVKRAALDWGFLHQGRFARDYLALFGESPVETLRTGAVQRSVNSQVPALSARP